MIVTSIFVILKSLSPEEINLRKQVHGDTTHMMLLLGWQCKGI